MNTEKTASEWFDLLIEPYCSQAKEASIKHPKQKNKETTYKTLYNALCFDFLYPPERNWNEWRELMLSVKRGETTYIKPTEPAQPKFGEWVKVEDGLPELDEVVLVIDNEGRRLISWRYKYDIMDDAEWSVEYPYNSDAFTHWMPLPPNPTN